MKPVLGLGKRFEGTLSSGGWLICKDERRGQTEEEGHSQKFKEVVFLDCRDVEETLSKFENTETPTTSNQPQLRNCYHHGVMLTMFCDSCEEPVCDQCTVVGPHNTQVG